MPIHERIFVVGAGIIGCSIALELASRGSEVTLLEQHAPLERASFAAAGMLAAADPHNPSELHEFSQYSLRNYDAFLHQVELHAGIRVDYQTSLTWQYAADGSRTTLKEHSLDPRELANALHQAVGASAVEVIANAGNFMPDADATVIYATGAWSGGLLQVPVIPMKGQMLRVALPSGFELREVHRSERVYIVPRLHGAQAGTALIGATVEDVGFNTEVDTRDLETLRASAAELISALASAENAPAVEAWAGLRPATPDQLPLIGALGERAFVATGHFRNGILLAPGTARVIADLVEGKPPALDLSHFAPNRFASHT